MPNLDVGGQAVIEGVMMRSKDRVATALRLPDGKIMVKNDPYEPISKKYKILGWPVVRGAVAFVEMLILGIKTLNFSADIAIQEQEKIEAAEKGEEFESKKKSSNSLALALSAIFAMGMGLFIFFFVPLWVADLLGVNKEALGFNLAAGTVRLTLFLAYVWLISQFKDFRRIFQYHGAEHKSIYALEERAATHTRLHPRCGTSFVLIVALIAIMIYAISDTIYGMIVGHPPVLWERVIVHFSLLPIVAGGSYELLKLSGKTRENKLTQLLIKPGLWLQLITTKEPTKDQLEVAIVALETALGRTESMVTAERVPAS